MADTVDLLFDASGPQEGTPVILLHGFPLSRAIWTNVMVQMGNEVRVIAPDLRGHGASPAPDVDYSVDLMADDVLALADKLGIDKFHLVGHSMGGYVAFSILRKAPERVDHLALVCTRSTPDSEAAKQGRRKQADMVQVDGMRALADLLVPKLVSPKAGELAQEEARRIVEGMPVTGAVHTLDAMANRPDSTPLLPTIKQPTLVVAGQDDQVMPPQETDLLAREIPNARKEVLSASGHLPMMEEGPKLAGALLAFLRSER